MNGPNLEMSDGDFKVASATFEADLINGRACCTCGVHITPESRVRHGGFWRCQACGAPPVCDCGHDKGWHEDFREKAAQPCLKCECVGFSTPRNAKSNEARCNCSAASWRDYHLATCPASSEASTSSDLPSSTGTKGDSL